MHRFWSAMILPLLEALRPRHVVEVGSDYGKTTFPLAKWCFHHQAQLSIIDPLPKFAPELLTEKGRKLVRFFRQRSLEALPELEAADIALIDGDHNWYTVYHELKMLHDKTVQDSGRLPPVIVMHDTGWPYGMRDLYYQPDSIPAEYRHPCRREGMLPEQSALTPEGFNNHLYNAEHEGGPQNGVWQAAEDFLAECGDDYAVMRLPVYHGLAVLMPELRLASSEALRHYWQARRLPDALLPLFWHVEMERVEYYNFYQHYNRPHSSMVQSEKKAALVSARASVEKI